MAQLWLLYPPPPLNYNLTMARDHRVLHYLFWKYPLPSFSRSRPSQGLLGTLPCSQEAVAGGGGRLCHSAMDSNLTTTKWAGFLWPDLNRDNPSSDPDCRTSARMWYMAHIKDELYHPPQASAKTWGICFLFFVFWSLFWNVKQNFHIPAASFDLLHLLPIPFSCSLPSIFQFHVFPGLLSLKGELALFKGCHQKCLSLISPSKVL